MNQKFVILAILDGWGISAPNEGNAISLSNIINISKLNSSCPHTQLSASGESVGLPRGEAGNTEVGHLNIGAGRIVYQDLSRINMSIAEGSFFKNPVFLKAFEHALKNKSNLHLMGLVGAGGVHSNIEHLFALLQLCSRNKFDRVFLHLFTDGRDSPATSSKTYIDSVKEVINKEGVGQIASIMGRYWAMDRDFRWDRTQKAYEALTQGKGELVKSYEEAIDQSYNKGKTDEFIEPSLICNSQGKPVSLISDNDAVIFFNFRVDRPRQLTRAFVYEDFTKAGSNIDFDPFLEKYKKRHLFSLNLTKSSTFNRSLKLKNLYFVTMTEYEKNYDKENVNVAFLPEHVDMPLGRIISEKGYRQLRVAESEKERFVTYYFNGLREKPFDLEDRLIVASPKVATYDLKPEMSAGSMTDSLLNKLKADLSYKFIIINYANPDMVGHTGNIGAAVKACEKVDECVGRLANFALAHEGSLIITADHGNVEEMINKQTGQIDTEHSNFPVPFIVVNSSLLGRGQTLQSGILADIAPTILALLGIPIPSEMSGRNLLKEII